MKALQILKNSKILLNLVLVSFLLLTAFACFAWFERVNSDAGYYLFKTINLRFFYMEHGRMVLWFAEILPLAGVWLGLPLFWVILLYSLNHVAFFACIAWFSYRITNYWSYPVVAALLTFCGLRESVFTPQFELYYGLGFLILFLALIHKSNSQNLSWSDWLLLAFSAIFTITSHPMALLLLLFGLLFHNMHQQKLFGKIWVLMAVLLIAYIIWKKMTISDYEGGKFGWYFDSIKNGQIWALFDNGHLKSGLLLLIKYYSDAMLLFLGVIVYLVVERKFRLLIFYIAGVFFFIFSAWSMYLPGPYLDRYLEQIWYPLVFAAFLPLVNFVRLPGWLIPVFIFSLVYRIYWVSDSYHHFHNRTVMMDKLINSVQKTKGPRFIATEADMGREAYDFANWSLAFETMLRSGSTGKRIVTITKEEDYKFNGNDSLLTETDYLFRMWEREPVSILNKHYFDLEPGEYKYLKP